MREQIENVSGVELQRVAIKLRLIGEKADMGKTFTASARESLKRHQAIHTERASVLIRNRKNPEGRHSANSRRAAEGFSE